MAGLKNVKMAACTSILLFFCAWPINAGEFDMPVKPAPGDKCIVCGMFVAQYPDWTGEIIFKDGQVLFFDGCKDLFRYLFDMKKYSPEKARSDISAIFVTQYYDVSFIDAAGACYVADSDVYGPMGRELIALQSASDARIFLKDHRGKQIYRFNEITPELVEGLD